MRGQHPFGLSACPGGIDDREIIFRTPRRRQTIQRPLLPLAVAPPLLLEIVESEDPGMLQPGGNESAGRIYHDNLLQLSQGRIAGSQLAKPLKRLYQQHGAFRMLEDMADLGRGARVIDRHRQGADADIGPIDQAPLDSIG